MRILLTGANGYVGKRLLPELLNLGHEVVCCVRNANRLGLDDVTLSKISIWETDFLDEPDLKSLPAKFDAAYYLIHSMSSSNADFDNLEARSARNFNTYADAIGITQVVFLSGIINDAVLSKHLQSRSDVEDILYQGHFKLTVLRAGIIVGSGSSSFEIIRDLCEKLPVMIAPKWILTNTQPIAIRDVMQYLIGVLLREDCYDDSFDIAGPNILTYKEMLLLYAKTRKIKLWIITVPVMTPKLSSYWLYFVTSTSYKLASNLVESMKMEVVARDKRLQHILGIHPISYVDAIKLAFLKIEQNLVISSWKDSLSSSRSSGDLQGYIQVPVFGCLKDKKSLAITDLEKTMDNIFSIGGDTGWYYGDWMWRIRGHMDKAFGGVGLRRGRTHPTQIHSGDSLDFWRVLLASRQEKRLLLFAEMKLPGEAWLEFYIDEKNVLHQIATFRPRGIWGRLYWYSLVPFHFFIFGGMIKKIAV
ncbi:MAG: epimerase [Flavobacterium sp. BFFFF1]|uniref:SDR family oxidoreductase n=1 Tax=Flavobacterium sp. BFFFF1 TaxID=2015557 RepID=UPI000BD52DDE|nr:SDR family oxidoreductase [Flavobacterium sp. BFFFF1]OYU79696.1 MAG: epimerase [Flavobacterium sp. BFFFF1]